MDALKISNLNFRFGKQVIFDNFSLSITDNGFYTLMGRNGSGKSTFFKLLLKKLSPVSGKIDIFDNNGDDVAYCMPDPLVFNNLTVLENLLIVSNDVEKINFLTAHFKIASIINDKTKYLSAGEKQRVCIIRTILEDKVLPILSIRL